MTGSDPALEGSARASMIEIPVDDLTFAGRQARLVGVDLGGAWSGIAFAIFRAPRPAAAAPTPAPTPAPNTGDGAAAAQVVPAASAPPAVAPTSPPPGPGRGTIVHEAALRLADEHGA